MAKTYLAVSLKDFHSSEKKWQGGSDSHVKVSVIGAKNLKRAKRVAQTDNNDAWYVVPFHKIGNIIHAK